MSADVFLPSMRTQLRVCPDCSAQVSSRAVSCPGCGHPFWPMPLAIFVVMFCGFAISALGGLMLYILSTEPLSLGPFTQWQRNRFTDLFLNLRLGAFAVIACGVALVVGSFWMRRAYK